MGLGKVKLSVTSKEEPSGTLEGVTRMWDFKQFWDIYTSSLK